MSERDNVDAETGEVLENPEASLQQAFGGFAFPVPAERDPQAAVRRVIDRVMNAGDLDSLFDVWEGKTSDELVGHVFEIHGVTFDQYESDQGPVPAVEVDAVDLGTGKRTTWWSSATNLVAFLVRAEQLSLFPFTARVMEESTSSGRKVLRFGRP